MTDSTLRRKLKQMVQLGNELDAEAKRRYGEHGLLLHEADGSLLVMDRYLDTDKSKTPHIKFCELGAYWSQGAF